MEYKGFSKFTRFSATVLGILEDDIPEFPPGVRLYVDFANQDYFIWEEPNPE